jgi:hypothetical protein
MNVQSRQVAVGSGHVLTCRWQGSGFPLLERPAGLLREMCFWYGTDVLLELSLEKVIEWYRLVGVKVKHA